jgi:hypothetical protein
MCSAIGHSVAEWPAYPLTDHRKKSISCNPANEQHAQIAICRGLGRMDDLLKGHT